MAFSPFIYMKKLENNSNKTKHCNIRSKCLWSSGQINEIFWTINYDSAEMQMGMAFQEKKD